MMPVVPTDPSMPFSGAVADSLELMKHAWGMSQGFNTPAGLPQGLSAMMTPTLNVEEIDKRITDLRAVEQWLNLNLNWLRATIQSLEVQRNTIATLQSFSGALAAAANVPPSANQTAERAESSASVPPAHDAKPTRDEASALSAMQAFPVHAAAWWQSLQDQFIKVAAAASQATAHTPDQPDATAPAPKAKKPSAKRARKRA